MRQYLKLLCTTPYLGALLRSAWPRSPDHQKYIDNSEPGAGLLIFENVILPFTNPIPSNTELYKIMTTRLSEVVEGGA